MRWIWTVGKFQPFLNFHFTAPVLAYTTLVVFRTDITDQCLAEWLCMLANWTCISMTSALENVAWKRYCIISVNMHKYLLRAMMNVCPRLPRWLHNWSVSCLESYRSGEGCTGTNSLSHSDNRWQLCHSNSNSNSISHTEGCPSVGCVLKILSTPVTMTINHQDKSTKSNS
jgi:hypothetical protein